MLLGVWAIWSFLPNIIRLYISYNRMYTKNNCGGSSTIPYVSCILIQDIWIETIFVLYSSKELSQSLPAIIYVFLSITSSGQKKKKRNQIFVNKLLMSWAYVIVGWIDSGTKRSNQTHLHGSPVSGLSRLEALYLIFYATLQWWNSSNLFTLFWYIGPTWSFCPLQNLQISSSCSWTVVELAWMLSWSNPFQDHCVWTCSSWSAISICLDSSTVRLQISRGLFMDVVYEIFFELKIYLLITK